MAISLHMFVPRNLLWIKWIGYNEGVKRTVGLEDEGSKSRPFCYKKTGEVRTMQQTAY